MPELQRVIYMQNSTSGAPIIEETTDPTSNLASMMRNNVVLFESRVHQRGEFSPAAHSIRLGRTTYVPATHHGGAYKPVDETELEALLEAHFDRLDEVFRRLS